MMATVLGWGKASSGELGIGGSDSNTVTFPCYINTLQDKDIRSISCGESHTLVCLQDGKVYSSGGNDYMQCGRDRNLTRFDHIEESLETQHVIEVAAGSSHSVVLTKTQEVFTWGKNDSGQLGRGDVDVEDQGIPRLVELFHGHCVLEVSCGNDHTIVFTSNGLVATWGSNSYGQLGIGQCTSPFLNQPQFVSSLKGIPVAQVAAGGNHSLMLSKSGAVYGWGRNDFGQLGINDTNDHHLPKQCRYLRSKQVKSISCGENHTACLTLAGQVFLFGAGGYGQLGHKINNNVNLPQEVLNLSASEMEGAEMSQIACGRHHTLVYVPASGHLYSFGLGGNGQLGISTTESKSMPVIVDKLFSASTKSLSDFPKEVHKEEQNLRIKTIHAGGDHSFVVALDKNVCQSNDSRTKDETMQTLHLSSLRAETLISSESNDQFQKEIVQIFSHASCLNGSFLSVKDNEHYGSSSKKHGVDMSAVKTFFTQLKNLQDGALIDQICTAMNLLISDLPTSPADVETLRLYLILPECHFFEEPKLYDKIICPLANAILTLDKNAQRVLETWWLSNEPTFFKRLVIVFRRCVEYLLSSMDTVNFTEILKRRAGLFTSMEMLKKLCKVSEAHDEVVPYKEFYIHQLRDCVNIQNDYINWIFQSERRKEGLFFWNYPFLYDAAAKSILLQIDSRVQMESAVQGAQEQAFVEMMFGQALPHQALDPQRVLLILKVSREKLVEDTLKQLQGKSGKDFKRPLRVSFEGEPGVDEGGVRKEFFILLFQHVMDPEFGMFKTMEDTDFLWFDLDTQKESRLYQMIGILCGLAIYNNVIIDLPFPLVLYKKLLKKPVTLDDMKELMPSQRRILQGVLDYQSTDESEAIYDLTFEYRDKELCADGANKAVTQANKKEFVDLAVDFNLNKSVQVPFKAFGDGFNSVCDGAVYESLHPEELQSLLVGNGNYDFNEFQKTTKYKDEYKKYKEDYKTDHPTIKFFWEVFHEMSLERKKKFLLFYRASDRVPVTGMKSVEMTIRPLLGPEILLPVAHTCFNLLDLPVYSTKEILQDRIYTAIEVQGFHLI